MGIPPIEDNPLRILGVFSNSTLREIEQNKAQLHAFARVGQKAQLPLWLNGLSLLQPLPDITEDKLAQAQAQLSLQADRDRYALFWFEHDSACRIEDEKAIRLLDNDEVFAAALLWEGRADHAAHKNLMLLAVLNDDWEEIAAHVARCFDGSTADFRRFMGEVLKTSETANGPDSCTLLDYFAEEQWNMEMKLLLVEYHKRTLDEVARRLEHTGTIDEKVQKQAVDEALDRFSHVLALEKLLGGDSFVYKYYANMTAKALWRAVCRYSQLDYSKKAAKWALNQLDWISSFLDTSDSEYHALIIEKDSVSERANRNYREYKSDSNDWFYYIIISIAIMAVGRTCNTGEKKNKTKTYRKYNYPSYVSPKHDSFLKQHKALEDMKELKMEDYIGNTMRHD